MKRFLLPLLLILGLSGCETLGLSDKTASIEDRNDDSAQSGSTASTASKDSVASTGSATGSGVETTGLGSAVIPVQPLEVKPLETSTGAGMKGMDSRKDSSTSPLGGSADARMKGVDPRKDPASPLSKRSIYFDFDSFAVKDEYRPVIEAHAAYLMAHRNARVILQGNTDSRGSREYNLALGQKRAEAVRRALMVLGVQDEQTEAVSFGEEKPRALGETEQDYAENRRTDIVYGDE